MSDQTNKTISLPTWVTPHEKKEQVFLLLIYVQPQAKNTALQGLYQGRLRIRIKAKPQDGKANKELLSFLSNIFNHPIKFFHLASGEHSKMKTILVEGLSPEIFFNIAINPVI